MTRLKRWLASARKTRRTTVGALAVIATAGLLVAPATAIDWKLDADTNVATQYPASSTDCPTFTSPPPAYDVFFNMSDMDKRGFGDATDQTSWNFSRRIGQIICGADQGATIRIGMFFIRALGPPERFEYDPEEIWAALEKVARDRKVKVELVLDGGGITSALGKKQVTARLTKAPIKAKIYWCTNGCLETNPSNVLPNSINHEKFIAISDTLWGGSAGTHPAVYSSSANISKGQTRNYMADGSLFYDDVQMHTLFKNRFRGMQYCADKKKGNGADSVVNGKYCGLSGLNRVSGQKLADGRSYGGYYPKVWVDPVYQHRTDSGRGTTVSFSPQPQTARDYFTKMFDDVDCKVDGIVRVGMFRLSDSRAAQFARAAERLAKRGCDVRILLSPKGGMPTITKATASLLRGAGIPFRCSATPLHTKYVLVGSRHNNEGRVISGTANMSTSGLRYSDEHMIIVDSRRTDPRHDGDARAYFAKFMAGWTEMYQGSTSCNPST